MTPTDAADGETWTKRWNPAYQYKAGFAQWQIVSPIRVIADKLFESDADAIIAAHNATNQATVALPELLDILEPGWREAYSDPLNYVRVIYHRALEVTAKQQATVARAEGRFLQVNRWHLGDTEERRPMYCLYLADDPDEAINWLRIGDVWEQEGADYLNALELRATEAEAALGAALATADGWKAERDLYYERYVTVTRAYNDTEAQLRMAREALEVADKGGEG